MFPELVPDALAKQHLLEAGVPLFSAALVGFTDGGRYVVCNFVPGLKVDGTGFRIVRSWVIATNMTTFGGDGQYYVLEREDV